MLFILLHADHKNFIYNSRWVLLPRIKQYPSYQKGVTPKKIFWVLFPCALSTNSTPARAEAAPWHIRMWLWGLHSHPWRDFPAHPQSHKNEDVASNAKRDSASAIAATVSLKNNFYHARGRTLDAEPPLASTHRPASTFHLALHRKVLFST